MLLETCDIEHQHDLLVTVFKFLAEHLDTKWLMGNGAVVEPELAADQRDKLLQWLLGLVNHSPAVVLERVGPPYTTGPEGMAALRALLCGFLSEGETRKGCTVGSVLQRLLRKAELGSVATDLRLAPERLLAHTFGVSRIVYGEAESQTEAVEIGGEEPVVPAPTRKSPTRSQRRKHHKHKKVVRADCMHVRNARREVAEIYEKKVIADGVDDRKGHRRDEMPEFLSECTCSSPLALESPRELT